MSGQLRIEFVVEFIDRTSSIVFARWRAIPPDFVVSDGYALGGIAMKPYLTQPRATHPNGSPRYDLFAFTLLRPSELGKFTVGAIVELTGIRPMNETPASASSDKRFPKLL